jgi:predicted DNA binding CopG/RHH family protein
MKKLAITSTTEAWEERKLGADEAHAKPVSQEMHDAIEESLGLKAISIRLPKSTIDTYKALAKIHGVGYQPLMRDAICRWAEGELKQMVVAAAQAKTPVPPPEGAG